MIRSRYLIVSPQEYRDRNGAPARLAYSARRAKLFRLDPGTADLLAQGEIDSIDSDQLKRLVDLEAVVPETVDELEVVLGNYRKGSADPAVRGFTIMPTSYCNMACDYCGQEHFKSAVDQAKFDRIAARVEAAIADPATKAVSVTWFGGEPLLALRVIRELSARFTAAADAREIAYSARMATNGSLLNARILGLLHHECRLAAMEVTIDGPREVHNRRRIKRNGIGSFDQTTSVLAEAVSSRSVPGLRIGIRVNIDQDNEETVDELLDELAGLGLAAAQVELHLMPVHSWGNDVSAVEMEARRYAQRETGWLRRAQELGFGIPTLPNTLKRTTCRATSAQGEIVDSAGRIYSCSEHPLVPGVRDTGVVATIDQLTGSGPRPAGMFDDWYDRVGDGTQACGRCPLLPVCGGSCPKLWSEGHIPCPSIKFDWHERVDLAARRLGYQPG